MVTPVVDGPSYCTNASRGPRISKAGSPVSAWSIPTNEELLIARHTRRILTAITQES
jgi:acetate kinase